MPLTPGTTLGSYSVTAQIGAGGMGEVYRARDTKLDRDAALKVLPEAFTSAWTSATPSATRLSWPRRRTARSVLPLLRRRFVRCSHVREGVLGRRRLCVP